MTMYTTPLIRQALATPYTEWSHINALIAQSNDPAEREELNAIMVRLYHYEEGMLDLIS